MNRTIFDKIGLPKPLAWAYLGILIFMMGDGIEQGWLSPYLIGRGLSLEQSAGLFTMYGVTIAISCLLYTSPSPRDMRRSRMPSSA